MEFTRERDERNLANIIQCFMNTYEICSMGQRYISDDDSISSCCSLAMENKSTFSLNIRRKYFLQITYNSNQSIDNAIYFSSMLTYIIL